MPALVPPRATPLERMLNDVAHLTMTAQAVRDGTFQPDLSTPAADRVGPVDALLNAADACEATREAVAKFVFLKDVSAVKLIDLVAALLDEVYEAGKYGDEDGRDDSKGKARVALAALYEDGCVAGLRAAAHVIGQTETPPSHPGVALALANFRAVLQCDLEGRAARREVSL